MDAFELLAMAFVLGAVFGGIIGATFCSAARLEASQDETEHGNYPL
jgi:ABC-type branched-subunit amino acid transport system permease subunit